MTTTIAPRSVARRSSRCGAVLILFIATLLPNVKPITCSLSPREVSHNKSGGFLSANEGDSLSEGLGSSPSQPTAASKLVTRFTKAFIASFGLILTSELGDKTFFIAAVLSMRFPTISVFGGAMSALALMTLLSALVGYGLPNLLSRVYTHYASILLFFFFGIRLLWDSTSIKPDASSAELAEVEAELKKDDVELAERESVAQQESLRSVAFSSGLSPLAGTVGSSGAAVTGVNGCHSPTPGRRNSGSADEMEMNETMAGGGGGDGGAVNHHAPSSFKKLGHVFNRVFVQAFTLTFVAEWGDRSQIATIALAASQDCQGVIVGATLGHAICTGAAVMGGSMLAGRISEKMVAISGGVLFIVFGFAAMYLGVD